MIRYGRYKYDEKRAKDVLGFDRLKTIADTKNADIILDGGDTFHSLSFVTVDKGKSVVKVMNKVVYTAMTPGNHEFNYGAEY